MYVFYNWWKATEHQTYFNPLVLTIFSTRLLSDRRNLFKSFTDFIKTWILTKKSKITLMNSVRQGPGNSLFKWCYLCRWLMSFSRLMWQCMWYPLGSLSSRRMETECRLCNRVKPHRLLCQFHPRIPHLGHIENNFRHRLWCMNKKFRAIVETMHCHKQMHFTPRGRKVCPHIFFQPDQKLWSHDFFFVPWRERPSPKYMA